VLHLFEVASGLDSLVVGETEILGQVKNAYEAAKAIGMTGKFKNVLFQRAIHVGKRVRSETAIAVGQTSVASAAVQLAERIFGELSESEVMILGSGAMAELTARHLMARKVAKLSIANRTREKAEALAGRFRGRAIAWEQFPEVLAHADIVIASTGSPVPIVTRDLLVKAQRLRAGRSLFLIDIAMPRDVEDEAHGLAHVYLYRLKDLETIVSENLKGRAAEVERARALVRRKAEEFCAWEHSWESGRETSLRHSEVVG
jgi:glutamyl-tRNA reductase